MEGTLAEAAEAGSLAMLHHTEQLAAQMAEMARVTAAYFIGLVEAGLTRREAMALTEGWQEIYYALSYSPVGHDDDDGL